MNNLNKNYAIDNVTVAGTSAPIGTTWLAGTRITDSVTGNIYILKTANNPGDTISQLITAGSVSIFGPVDLGAVNATYGTVVEEGSGSFHKTTITLDGAFAAIAGGANLAVGRLIYTFPAGVIRVNTVFLNGIALQQTEGNVTADTPDVGIGTTLGAGAIATLDAGSEMENLLTGQTFTDCDGTAERAGAPTPLATAVLTAAADHTVYLNAADGWAASGDAALGFTGDVVITWELLS